MTSTSPPSSLRVVRHESALSRWEAVFRAPGPALAGCVLGDYQGWTESATSFPSRLEAPFPGVVLILDFGSGFRLMDPRAPRTSSAGHPGGTQDLKSFVAGLSDSYVYVAARGASRCIQVDLTPLGARRLLGLPMDSLANRTVDLGDVLGGEGKLLEERLAGRPSTWEARFDLLDRFLAARLAKSLEVAPGVAWAWERLRSAGGCLEIGHLTRELGWSRKHLVARFREQVGLPKTVARVFRFHRVVEHLRAAPAPRWAEVAYDCGYYDQAHLIRDFGEFTGQTPTEYLRRLLPGNGGVAGA